MFTRISFAIALTVACLVSAAPALEFKKVGDGPTQSLDVLAAQAEVVVLGKVTEIEKDAVEATPFAGAPKEQKLSYKIVVLKIDAALIGGQGLTQIRVGFSADAPVGGIEERDGLIRLGGRRGYSGGGAVALTAGQEGCFFLTPHHDGDFYVMAGNGGPLDKKGEGYAKKLEGVQSLAKAIDDPVAALKVKDVTERFTVARFLLQRYQRARSAQARLGGGKREAIPADENKLILDLVAELPWLADDGSDIPSRNILWALINPNELGYKQPAFPQQQPGAAPINYNKIQDETSAKFLKDNEGKIKIKRYAAGK